MTFQARKNPTEFSVGFCECLLILLIRVEILFSFFDLGKLLCGFRRLAYLGVQLLLQLGHQILADDLIRNDFAVVDLNKGLAVHRFVTDEITRFISSMCSLSSFSQA